MTDGAGRPIVRGLGLAAVVVAFSATAAAQGFVGAEVCATCHPWEYKKWLAGPHARANHALSPEQQRDARCTNCHTTLPGASERLAQKLPGVQCEKCHGPGRYYHPRYVMKDPELARAVGLIDSKPEHCEACHDAGSPSVEPFSYAKMWALIDHGKQAREAAQAGK